MLQPTEEWRDIFDYEGIYQISNLARVKSLTRQIVRSNGIVQTFKERLRPHAINVNGYRAITLNKEGGYRRFLISHLVARAFLGPRPRGKVVAHIDGKLEHNYVSNLAYKTNKENAADQLLHGTRARGSRSGRSKLKEKQVFAIRKALLGGVTATVLARKYGVSIGAICRISKNKNWKHLLDNRVSPR